MYTLLLLAQEGQEAAKDTNDGSSFLFPLMLVAIGFLFYFLLIRPQRRQQNDRQTMLAQLKKNDRVVTIGGIHGVVTAVSIDDDKVTIRVDESSGTKMDFALMAIARVVTDGDEKSDTKK